MAFAVALLLGGCATHTHDRAEHFSHFIGVDDFSQFSKTLLADGSCLLESQPITTPLDWNELVVSWNAQAPPGSGLEIQARTFVSGHATRYYTMARWSPDNILFKRTSVPGQEDADGTVATDTLILTGFSTNLQVRVRLEGSRGKLPRLTYLGLSLSNTHSKPPSHPANHAAWGIIIPTPERSENGYAGSHGWCSPASISMVMDHWAEVLDRPELNHGVPEVAGLVYDEDYSGFGNWPMNTAYAGSFSGMRAIVTRLDDLSELEDWITADVPVILSARWNLLEKGRTDTGNGHLLVCIGFTPTGDVVCNDPATDTKRHSIRRIYSRKAVKEAWATSQNTVYLVYPTHYTLPYNRYGQW